MEQKKDVLIALMNNKRDFAIAQQENWYRIPGESAPRIVRDRRLRYLAFYHTKVFGDDAFKILWMGEVTNISIVKRRELLPDIQPDPKADNEYYKIGFKNLAKLSQPIFSRRHRRILFISTTLERLLQARELNDVFWESPIEEKLWHELKSEGIDAERQYLVQTKDKNYLLDFALWGKDRNIDIECNGDRFHTEIEDVKRDKQRNNILESLGWAVLRYTSAEIKDNTKKCIEQIKDTVNRYGGLQHATDATQFRYLGDDKGKQIRLF